MTFFAQPPLAFLLDQSMHDNLLVIKWLTKNSKAKALRQTSTFGYVILSTVLENSA